jgi:hypothetical protein
MLYAKLQSRTQRSRLAEFPLGLASAQEPRAFGSAPAFGFGSVSGPDGEKRDRQKDYCQLAVESKI